MTRFSRDATDTGRRIERALSQGALSAAQLTKSLDISQSTLSRTIHESAHSIVHFRVTGQRTPLYGLLRSLPAGLNARQRIHRYPDQGHIRPFADGAFLAGGGTLERAGERTTLYAGLPPYMAFAAPSGFLGQRAAQDAARDAHFPASLKDWNNEHRVAWLFTQGLNLPGNLVFGDTALQQEMHLCAAAPITHAQRAGHYVAQASTRRTAAFGPSAGGEQPKFLCLVEDRGPVIVKFARRGSRMAPLLGLEHLALRALGEIGVPAAATRLLSAGDFVFLEVLRFDRVGPLGRIGMLSAGAVDDEMCGRRDSWSAFAQRCVQSKILAPGDALQVDTAAAFSELIGNTDRHFEKILLLIDESGEYRGVAPAYDILPMRYASIGGGLDPELTPIEPKIGDIGPQPRVWGPAAHAAGLFWRWARTEKLDVPVPLAMKKLAAKNLAVAREFSEPLL